MSEKQDRVNKVLTSFISLSSSIHAAAVMTRDGVPIASKLHKDVNVDRLSAMSASLLSLGDRAAKDLKQGDLKQVLIECAEGFVVMLKVGDNAVLSVMSEQNARLGMLLVEARKSAAMIAKIV
ncbi:MAG: roadblock/LC7 domain-containing protein [Gammaproteobacteria bacterium]|nr:roadblock/LC7 domain-containing protein [Gammaproteobacteria bacterium]